MWVALIALQAGWLLATAALAAWAIAWIVGAISVFRRQDLGAGTRAAWLAVLFVLPLLGLLVYYLWDAARPKSA
jgi:uncharacterized membrane protein